VTTVTELRAVVLGCSLKPSAEESSSDLIGRQVLEALTRHGVTGEVVRVVDQNVKSGVTTGPKPDTTGPATATLAANAAHLARLLAAAAYPPS
jgi:hypothetical protein